MKYPDNIIKASKVIVLLGVVFSLASCSSSSSLKGEIFVRFQMSEIPCDPRAVSSAGSIKTGKEEVIGRVEITEFLREVPSEGDANSITCVYSYESSDLSIDGDILIIEFGGSEDWSGRWVVPKSEFEDGSVDLDTN
jgi:hypothetical protein